MKGDKSLLGVHSIVMVHEEKRRDEDTLEGNEQVCKTEAGLLVPSTELPGLLLVAGGPGAGLLALMALGAGNDNGAFLLHGLGRTATAPAGANDDCVARGTATAPTGAPTAAASRGATSSTSGAHNDLLARSSTAAAVSSSHTVA